MNNISINSPLVSVDWLNKNLEANNLIILDATISKVSNKSLETVKQYIPKSNFFDIKKKFSDVSSLFPNTIPTTKQFQTEARILGVNTNSCIVIYDTHGIYSSARAWWLFKYFGHENVAVLDGGLQEWKANNFKLVETYKMVSVLGNFKAITNLALMTNFHGVNQHAIAKDSLILDARSSSRFFGETPEPRQGLRSGTITNSKNLPFSELLNGNKLKSTEALKPIFDTIINDETHLVFSCGSGITACILALGATLAGFEDLTVYDGSWTEYGTLTQ